MSDLRVEGCKIGQRAKGEEVRLDFWVWDAAAEDGVAVDCMAKDGTAEDGTAELSKKGGRYGGII